MLSDPIAALATAAGRSALAVVRLTGGGAFEVAARVIAEFRRSPARVSRLAEFRDADGVIDRGLYTVFAGPASYTGEDLVEFSCHGGLVAPARLLSALHAAGARPAHPGEFTRRAVMNGKMDLLQAEAVGDLIDATAPAQARSALHQLDGGLSRRLAEVRDGLIELQALLGYDVDFPEEDDGPVAPARIQAALERVTALVDRLVATAPAAERLREGALVVLAGPPNAGKSSLFNALLGADRALVTEIAGTTRDAIEVATSFLGWPVRLVDTAGLSDTTDRIDLLGIAVSRRYIEAADLVLLCSECGAAEPSLEDVSQDTNVLRIRTKRDLALKSEPGLTVSSVTGDGLDTVRSAVAVRIFGDRVQLADLEPALTRARHREALARALEALHAMRPLLGKSGDAVLASHQAREASLALDELIGTVDIEQVLDRLFASFCVGK
ncbi:MAG: tRNA uridine-5-carboxymethylaminomethyl(34) synthesis GTPase MnmE [Gemmatimonadota bacterium]